MIWYRCAVIAILLGLLHSQYRDENMWIGIVVWVIIFTVVLRVFAYFHSKLVADQKGES